MVPMPEVKFFADCMVGKLAKWLRLMGFYVEYANSELSDSEIIGHCRGNGLFLLSRDKEICIRYPESMYIRSYDHNEQLKQVLRKFPPEPSLYFTRCPVCNGPNEKINTSDFTGHLLENVKERFSYIYRCEDCGKVYWEGSHFDAILGNIRKIVKEL